MRSLKHTHSVIVYSCACVFCYWDSSSYCVLLLGVGIAPLIVFCYWDSSSYCVLVSIIVISKILINKFFYRIDHIATLPRRNNDFKRQNNNGERVTRSFSDEQCCLSSHDDKGVSHYTSGRCHPLLIIL